MKSKNLTIHEERSDDLNNHYLVSKEQYLSANLYETLIDNKLINDGYLLNSYELTDDEKIKYECDNLYILVAPKDKNKEISLLSFHSYGSETLGFCIMYKEDYEKIKNKFLELEKIEGHLDFESFTSKEFLEEISEKDITKEERDVILKVFGSTFGFDFIKFMRQNIEGDVW